jgi:uncharacterized protein with PQ loop repeat
MQENDVNLYPVLVAILGPEIYRQVIEAFQLFITVYGTAMSIGPAQQAWKIYRAKSARDVSLFNFAWVGAGTGFWLIEGLFTSNSALIVSNIVGTATYMVVVVVILWYRKSRVAKVDLDAFYAADVRRWVAVA